LLEIKMFAFDLKRHVLPYRTVVVLLMDRNFVLFQNPYVW